MQCVKAHRNMEEVLEQILEVLEIEERGLTIIEIAERVKVNRNSVAKYLSILESYGQISMKCIGRAKVYNRSKRIPFSKIIDSLSDGIISLDEHLNIIDINNRACALFNKEKTQMVGSQFTDVEVFRRISPKILNALLSDESYITVSDIVEFEVSGMKKKLELQLIPSIIRLGELRLTLIIKDITEQDKKTRDLEHQVNFLQNFIKNTPAPVAMFDKDMRYIAVSDRWLTDYQLEESNIIGKSHYEIFPEVPEEWRVNHHQRALAGERVVSYDDEPFYRKDGSVDWLHWDLQPWKDSSGEIVGIIMYTEVVTKRKNIELELKKKSLMMKETRDALFFALNALMDGIELYDEYEQLIFCNNEFCKMYNLEYGPQLLERRTFREILELFISSPLIGSIVGSSIKDNVISKHKESKEPILITLSQGEQVIRREKPLDNGMLLITHKSAKNFPEPRK